MAVEARIFNPSTEKAKRRHEWDKALAKLCGIEDLSGVTGISVSAEVGKPPVVTVTRHFHPERVEVEP